MSLKGGIFFVAFSVILDLSVAQQCIIPATDIEFEGATLDGTLFIGNKGPVVINNQYYLPKEELQRIKYFLDKVEELLGNVEKEHLSVETQKRLLETTEKSVKETERRVEREKVMVSLKVQEFSNIREAFFGELEQIEAAIHKAISSLQAIKSGPLVDKIETLKVKTKYLISNTRNCLINEFSLTELEDTASGERYYGFVLSEIRDDPNIIFIGDYHEGFARVRRNNKYGYYNQKGYLDIEFQFDYAENFLGGTALVRNHGKWFLIGTEGETVFEFEKTARKIDRISWDTYILDSHALVILRDQDILLRKTFKFFNGEYAEVECEVGGKKKMGLINLEGKEIIPCVFDKIELFREDHLARVENDRLMGLHDLNGNLLTECKYTSLGGWSWQERKKSLFLPQTNLIEVEVDNPDWRRRKKKESIWLSGLIDSCGHTIVGPGNLSIRPHYFDNVITVTKSNGKSDILNAKGEVVLADFIGNVVHSFNDTLCLVSKNNLYGLLDKKNGGLILDVAFKDITWLKNSTLFEVKCSNGYYGYYDIYGNLIHDCRYGLAYRNDIVGIEVISGIGDFDERGVNIISKDGLAGLINNKGEIILDPEYDYLYYLKDTNFLKAVKDGDVGLIDIEGDIIVGFRYDEIHDLYENELLIISKEYINPGDSAKTRQDCIRKFVDENGKIPILYKDYGVVTLSDLEIIPPLFEKILFKEGNFYALLGNCEFLINEDGICVSSNSEYYTRLVKEYYSNK